VALPVLVIVGVCKNAVIYGCPIFTSFQIKGASAQINTSQCKYFIFAPAAYNTQMRLLFFASILKRMLLFFVERRLIIQADSFVLKL
jgi:hypothetical protein